jgi:hypothetical protein
MTSNPHSGQADLLAAIKRRPVGKGAWKMAIQELIESERASLRELRAIGNRHPNDIDTQRHINSALFEAADRIAVLSELLHYRDAGTCEEEHK